MLNFTFTFSGKYLHNDRWGVRQRIAIESPPVSRSVTQFKVAFADACLNNLQSTVGFPCLSLPLPLPLAPCPLPLTPSQIEASDGRAPPGRVGEKGRVGWSRNCLPAVRVFRLLSSLALFINMLQVYPTHNPLPSFPYRLAFATILTTC